MKKRANEIVAPAVDGALITVDEAALLTDLKVLIQTARQRIALVANSTMTLLYWNLGRRMLKENLQDGRAAYGKRILATVSRELTELNWTHYRPLASQENAAFECSVAPTGRPNHSPGQRRRCPRLLWNCPVGALQGAAS